MEKTRIATLIGADLLRKFANGSGAQAASLQISWVLHGLIRSHAAITPARSRVMGTGFENSWAVGKEKLRWPL